MPATSSNDLIMATSVASIVSTTTSKERRKFKRHWRNKRTDPRSEVGPIRTCYVNLRVVTLRRAADSKQYPREAGHTYPQRLTLSFRTSPIGS